MDPSKSLDRMGGSWENLHRFWEEKGKSGIQKAAPEPVPHRPFTIALSRETGTRGPAVGQEVGKRLGWAVYDRELVDKIAQEMGLRTSLLESLDERWMTGMEEALTSFLALTPVSQSAFIQYLIKTVLALGVHGECVIVGRGAPQILPPETTLRVRLVGHLKDRISNWSKQNGISLKEAEQQVETIDRERHRFARQYFQKDTTDPSNYDLILNISQFTVEECAELIIAALRCRQARRREPRLENPQT
jgi:cytidylate kinase